MTELDTVELFMSLFQGRQDCWGSVEGKCNKEPVTRLNYEAHLAGKVSLGIYPLLDSGQCFFASVDLDEKNFAKIQSVRNELAAVGIKAYISQSKSKGFHLELFADSNGWLAKDVREMLGRCLNKLGFKSEIFPKQDKLDNNTQFGSYINLCCFGDTRPFLSAEQIPVPTEQALKLIQRNSHEAIIKAISALPPIPPLMMPVRPEKKPAEKTKALKSPPCIERILKGTPAGMRDEAAFALARHLLDQGDIPEEVLSRLLIWDARNQPPIGDMRVLQDKVESAEKGYAFGCTSITGGILSGFCPGKTSCEWLKREVERKTKAGLIRTTSFYEEDDLIYEEVIKNPTESNKAEYKFICCDLKKGIITETKEIHAGEITLIPIYNKAVADELVIMPSGVEEYGTIEKLMKEIEIYIHKYADFSAEFQEWASWWVLMTWVYDRLPSVSYLRFLGTWGSGKSRALDTIGSICYKRTKITGAVTPPAIYRVLDQFRGTLVIDENDMDNKSEIAETLTKILNSGIERGSPIIRCLKDGDENFDIQTFKVFGPKVFATRNKFEDMALESRCLTTKMVETTRPINSRDPDSIPFTTYNRECLAATDHLRNKLLMFRFRHLSHVPKIMGEDDCLDIDLGKISGRLKQVTLPFSTIFRDNPETMDKFRRFLERYQKEIYGETADSYDGRIAAAMFSAAVALGKEKITCADVAHLAKEEGVTGRGGIDVSPNVISRVLKGMGIETKTPAYVDVVEDGHLKRRSRRFIKWDSDLMQKVYTRYQAGLANEELKELGLQFEGPVL